MTDETLNLTDIDLTDIDSAAVDLTNCDREPIHRPGLIQPHGILLVLQESTLEIIQVSSNTADLLDRQPAELLGKPLSELLDAEQVKLIQACLVEDFETINPLSLSIKRLHQSVHFDGIVHRIDPVIILELEPKQATSKADFFCFLSTGKRGRYAHSKSTHPAENVSGCGQRSAADHGLRSRYGLSI